MTKFKRIALNFILSLSFFSLGSMSYASGWFNYDAQKQVTIQVDLFLTSTCPHCHKADGFFRDIEKKEPWLIVNRYVINQNKSALDVFYQHLQKQHSNNFSVPAIFFCDSRWAGFADEKTTGKVLLQALSYCRQKITQEGNLSSETINVLQKWGNASQIQISSSIEKRGGTLLLLTALSDALNPCSLFCLATLLAFLWLYPTQKRTQLKVGGIYLFSQGVIHFLQQAHSAGYYRVVPHLHFAAMLIGLLLLVIAVLNLLQEKSKDDVKYRVGVITLVLLTGMVVPIYQQTCELNLGLFFERWLTEQSMSLAKHQFFQLSYQIIYLLPLFLLLLLHCLFSGSNWMVRHQQCFKIAASLILGSIGIILLVFPTWLVYLWVSMVVLFGAIIIGWLVERRYEQIN